MTGGTTIGDLDVVVSVTWLLLLSEVVVVVVFVSLFETNKRWS